MAVDLRTGNFYSAWRTRHATNGMLRDEDSLPPETLLQAVWHHQRLRRDSLKTTDGRTVRVLHPGFLSSEGGPDFRGAIIQFGQEKAVTGDVEVDLHAHNWRAHGHATNPAFGKVVLHVVWTAGEHSDSSTAPLAGQLTPPPVVIIREKLDAPLLELNRWLELVPLKTFPENLRGRCAAPLKELDAAELKHVLHAAAQVRFKQKAAAMRARAQEAGWEQTLWEQLFRALGYKQNIWPMQNLAESRLQWLPEKSSVFAIQARLLGLSGLLPVELTRTRKSPDNYVRRTWDAWWRERDEFSPILLPREIWKFHGLRPANQPQRRLALAAHWLASAKLISKIEQWCVAKIPEAALVHSLHEILRVNADEFWAWHWTLQSARLTKPQPLLGEARVTDLAINVILPWLWVRAVTGGNLGIQAEMERRYFAWPCAADNSVLKLARQRLLGTGSLKVLPDAASQQGLMQITRDFCDHSNALCEECQFPDLVRQGTWR